MVKGLRKVQDSNLWAGFMPTNGLANRPFKPLMQLSKLAEVGGVQPPRRNFTDLAVFKTVYHCQLGTSKSEESQGFEPWDPEGPPLFKSGAISLSANSPNITVSFAYYDTTCSYLTR